MFFPELHMIQCLLCNTYKAISQAAEVLCLGEIVSIHWPTYLALLEELWV
jgi:hypothetical protein